MLKFISNIPMIINNTSIMKDVSAQNVDLSGNLDVSGTTSMGSNLDIVGSLVTVGISKFNSEIRSNNFLVAHSTGDTTIGGTLEVNGVTTLNDQLNANGGINCDNKFIVYDETGNTLIGGKLDVSGNATINHNTTIGGTLEVTGMTTFYGGISAENFSVSNASGDTTIGGKLDVSGVTTLKGLLVANGGINCDNKFIVSDITGNTLIGGTLDVSGNATINNNTTINGTLQVTGVTTLNDQLNANGGINCNNKFIVYDETGNTHIYGDLTVVENTTIYKNTTISGTLEVIDVTTLKEQLNANGGINCDNKFIVYDETGDTLIGGKLDVSGNATINNNTNLKGTLEVTGVTTLNDKLNANGGINCNNLNVRMDASFNRGTFNQLIVDGPFKVNELEYNKININSNVLISTSIDISNEGDGPALKVRQGGIKDDHAVALFNAGSEGDALLIDNTGKSIFYKDTSFNENVKIKTLIVNETSTLYGNVGIGGSSSPTHKLLVTGSERITENLEVSGTTTITGSLNVKGTISGYGTIPIGGIIIWSGSINDIPNGWKLCNGDNLTPDLRAKFVIGAYPTIFNVNQSGGSFEIAISQLPSHNHTCNILQNGAHNHDGQTGESGNTSHNHAVTAEQGAHNHNITLYKRNSDDNGQSQNVISVNTQNNFQYRTFNTDNDQGGHNHTILQGNASHTHSFNTGIGGSHNHTVSMEETGQGIDYMQPYYVLAYIMRVT